MPSESNKIGSGNSNTPEPPDWRSIQQSSSSSSALSNISNDMGGTGSGSGSGSRPRGTHSKPSAKLKGKAYIPSFALTELDARKLKIGSQPLQVEMPVIGTRRGQRQGAQFRR